MSAKNLDYPQIALHYAEGICQMPIAWILVRINIRNVTIMKTLRINFYMCFSLCVLMFVCFMCNIFGMVECVWWSVCA